LLLPRLQLPSPKLQPPLVLPCLKSLVRERLGRRINGSTRPTTNQKVSGGATVDTRLDVTSLSPSSIRLTTPLEKSRKYSNPESYSSRRTFRPDFPENLPPRSNVARQRPPPAERQVLACTQTVGPVLLLYPPPTRLRLLLAKSDLPENRMRSGLNILDLWER
jgi:hypothetical protein